MAIFTPVKYQTGQSDSLYWGAITAFSRSTDKTSAGSLKLLKNTSTAILQDMFQLSLAGKKKKQNSGDKSLQKKKKKNLYSRSFGRKPVISSSPKEPL